MPPSPWRLARRDASRRPPGYDHLLGWLPRGTHDWSRFLTPDELGGMIVRAGLEPVDRKGIVFDPIGWTWRLSERDLDVNYVTAAVRPR